MSHQIASIIESKSLLANGFSFAFDQSSGAGIAICVTLLILSSFSWAVMITKFLMVRRVRKQSAKFLADYRGHQNPLQLLQDDNAASDAPVAHLYRAGARELAFHLAGARDGDADITAKLETAGKLKPSHMDPVECAMERSIGSNAGRLESQMGVLATAVSGAPFLGLLGTVWGVMDTFGSVAAAEGAASLKTMAPGVSAALLTTVVALLVAIPAMFGYNYLVNKIKGMVADLDNFRSELRTAFERWYVDHGRPISAPAISGRRLTASDLLNGSVEAPTTQPSHRIVKRTVAPDADLLIEEAEEAEELELVGEDVNGLGA
jgi:biopolymer transport protein TolQ